MASIVSCLCWVGKGKAKSLPDKITLDKEELDALIKASDDVSSVVKPEKEHIDSDSCSAEDCSDDDVEKLYDLDKYDDEDNEDDCTRASGCSSLPPLAGLSTFASNDDDPLITSKDSDDEDDFQINPSDNLVLIGKANGDHSTVEVHVFNEEDNHSFCHHEILINSYPLALEWLDYDPEQATVKGNFFAVGTLLPVIEIWDIDLVDTVEPVQVLGKKKKKKSKKKKELSNDDSHDDAVMAISWNSNVRSILASASADNTVRVWDLSESKCLVVLEHPDKVQAVQWHRSNPALLVSGCYDSIVRLYNCEDGSLMKHWKLNGEIEKVVWNMFNPDCLLVSTDQMSVAGLSVSSDSLLFNIDAHTEAVTDVSLSCEIDGLIVTCSTDDTVSFWDIKHKKPIYLSSRKLHMGGILCAKFCVDSSYTIAVGGQEGDFKLINVLTLPELLAKYKKEQKKFPSDISDPTTGDNSNYLSD